MEENSTEMRSLALTPTWSVATVLTIFVAVSLLVERSIHRLSNVSYTHIILSLRFLFSPSGITFLSCVFSLSFSLVLSFIIIFIILSGTEKYFLLCNKDYYNEPPMFFSGRSFFF